MFDRKAYMKAYYAERYKRRKKGHLCTVCGVKLPEDNVILQCRKCSEKTNIHSKRWHEKQKRELIRKLLNR